MLDAVCCFGRIDVSLFIIIIIIIIFVITEIIGMISKVNKTLTILICYWIDESKVKGIEYKFDFNWNKLKWNYY